MLTLSASDPETMVAAVAANANWKNHPPYYALFSFSSNPIPK